MTLTQLASQYQIDSQKNYFPVNTLRLFYLIFIQTLSDKPQENAQQLLNLIAPIGDIVDQRSEFRSQNENSTLEQEWQAVQINLNNLLSQANNSQNLKASFIYLFSYILPLQDNLLLSLLTQTSNHEDKLNPQHVYQTLAIRAMDSLVYSQAICEFITDNKYHPAIHYLTNLAYQINDLIDAIVHAKEDIENKSFSPFEIIKQIAPEADQAKELIKATLENLISKTKQFTLPENTQQLIDEFMEELVKVIG